MEKLKNIFSQHKKLTLGIIILLALSLPFVVNQALQRQDLRQQASTGPEIQVIMSPNVSTTVGATSNASVLLTTSTNDVGSLTTKLIYDDTMVELSSFTFPSKLQAFQEGKSASGVYGATLLNPTSDVVTGNSIVVISFQVKALKAGTTTIKVAHESTSATATGHDAFLPVANVPAMKAIYTITDGTTPSPTNTTVDNNPTITPTNTPTSTPTNTPTPTPIPTATSAPTATPIPGDTLLRIATYLPGIGSGAANLGLNSTPIHPQREGTLTILNTNSEVIKTVTGPIQYSSESGVYSGTFALGTTFPTGIYNIKLRMNNTLVKLYPSAMNIASGQNNSQTGTNPTLIPGDLNSDNSLGVFDWTYMIACIKDEAACTSAIRLLADLNDNGSVDEKDVQILQRGFALRDGD